MPSTVSTKEIAQLLGLSRSTVTRALNDDPKIKKETVERVRALAKELGYQKNSIARSLVSGRTNIVGCIVPNVVDPFFGEMVTQINTRLGEVGMGMLLGLSNDDDTVAQHLINTLMNYRVDGMLLNDTRGGYFRKHILQVRRANTPIVMLGDGESVGLDSVMGDDEKGAYDLVSYMARVGYSRIAFVGDLGHVLLNMRLQGYRNALLENNLRYSPDYVVDCGRLAEAREIVNRLMALPAPPDAIFCYNDFVAIAIHHALSVRGYRVPEDIGVAGFDNIAIASELICPLTTVDLRMEETITQALDLLLSKINARRLGEEQTDPPQHLRIQPRLCIRETLRMQHPAGVQR